MRIIHGQQVEDVYIHTNGIESIAPTTTAVNHRASKAPVPYRMSEYLSSESNCKYSRSPQYSKKYVKPKVC